MREGYGRQFLIQDLIAGVTVGVIALPLAMAFAINSGPGDTVRPEQGLYTAIIAGFLVAALGGSRVSVAGPTGAFVPILFVIVAKHGYTGLCIATMMAGVILILMGVARLGSLIKLIPYPVTTGFTAGIGLIIFSQQIKDLFGLEIQNVPGGFVEKWITYFSAMYTINWATSAVAIGSFVLMVLIRRYTPRIPSAIVAVVLAAVVVVLFGLDHGYGVQTIESRFGGIPRGLPMLTVAWWPEGGMAEFFAKARELIPEATTIALLGAIESLLCCVVADGMIGDRHKSNVELMALGTGNIASIFFGGIPATGAIARTAANIKSGAKTPLASMVHALFILIAMLLLAPYAGKIPLAVLASVLVLVAWNMSELDHFTHLFRAPRSDVLVLLTTFGLTVLADLTIAVGVGMVLASLLFMKRMSEVTNVGVLEDELRETSALGEFPDLTDPNAITKRDVPQGVEVYEINGPFFFGVADLLKDTLRGLESPPKVCILRLRRVPVIDATGMHALEEFYDKCRRQGTRLLLAGIHAQPIFALTRFGMVEKIGEQNLCGNIDEALNRARQILGLQPVSAPVTAEPEVARERSN